MGYDLFPRTTMQMKEKILQQAYEEQWLLLFEHTPEKRAGYLSKEKNKYLLSEVKL